MNVNDVFNSFHEVGIKTEMESMKIGSGFLNRSKRNTQRLYAASAICLLFTITEFVGAWLSDSLALLADGAHMFSDLVAYMIALLAIWFSSHRGTKHFTFGYHRAEIIGAFVSVMIIWVVTIMLVIEAIERFQNPKNVNGGFMAIIAGLGVISNITITYVIGMHGHGLEVHDHSGGSCSHDHSHRGCGSHNHSHNKIIADDNAKIIAISNKKQLSSSSSHGEIELGHMTLKNAPTKTHSSGCCGGHVHDEEDTKLSKSPRISEENNVSMALLRSASSTNHQILQDHSHSGDGTTNQHHHLEARTLTLTSRPNSSCNHHHHHHEHEHRDSEGHDSNDSSSSAAGDVNMHAAYLHAMTDILQNLGVFIAACFIYFGGDKFRIMDPICTVAFSILILFSTYGLTKDILFVLMEGSSVDCSQITSAILNLDANIVNVEDIHSWSITMNRRNISVKVILANADDGKQVQNLLRRINRMLFEQFGIAHSTVQMEQFTHPTAELTSPAACEAISRLEQATHALCYLPVHEENISQVLQDRRRKSLNPSITLQPAVANSFLKGIETKGHPQQNPVVNDNNITCRHVVAACTSPSEDSFKEDHHHHHSSCNHAHDDDCNHTHEEHRNHHDDNSSGVIYPTAKKSTSHSNPNLVCLDYTFIGDHNNHKCDHEFRGSHNHTHNGDHCDDDPHDHHHHHDCSHNHFGHVDNMNASTLEPVTNEEEEQSLLLS